MSLRLGGGETVALVGPNGAGKSSILSALAGLVRSTASKAVVGGRDVVKAGTWLDTSSRILSTSSWPPPSSRASARRRRDLAGAGRWLLEQFHLTAHRYHHPLTLSGGQARRLSVATMVSEERDVVVLDEPTYGRLG